MIIDDVWWVSCDHCDKEARSFDIHVGCSICGGECGDISYVGFYCNDDAKFFGIKDQLPLCIDPIFFLLRLDAAITLEN